MSSSLPPVETQRRIFKLIVSMMIYTTAASILWGLIAGFYLGLSTGIAVAVAVCITLATISKLVAFPQQLSRITKENQAPLP